MSENLAILRPSGWFSENFADFIQKYGFQTPLQGLNYPFPSPASLMRFIPGWLKGIHYEKPVSPILPTLRQITTESARLYPDHKRGRPLCAGRIS